MRGGDKPSILSEQSHPRKWVAGGSDNEHRHGYREGVAREADWRPTAQTCRPRIKESNWSCGLELNRHRVNTHGNPHDHRPTIAPSENLRLITVLIEHLTCVTNLVPGNSDRDFYIG